MALQRKAPWKFIDNVLPKLFPRGEKQMKKVHPLSTRAVPFGLVAGEGRGTLRAAFNHRINFIIPPEVFKCWPFAWASSLIFLAKSFNPI